MIQILCGSPTDQYFTGGTPFTNSDGSTLRFADAVAGGFSYRIPVSSNPWKVTLGFSNPNPTPRSQSIRINGQTTLDRFDPAIAGDVLTGFSRSFLAFPADGFIQIDLVTLTRSAVLSSITLVPFDELIAFASLNPETVRVTGVSGVWWADLNGYVFPRPVTVSDPTVQLVYSDVAVFSSGGIRYFGFTASQHNGQLLIQGIGAGTLLSLFADYTAILPLPPSPAA